MSNLYHTVTTEDRINAKNNDVITCKEKDPKAVLPLGIDLYHI